MTPQLVFTEKLNAQQKEFHTLYNNYIATSLNQASTKLVRLSVTPSKFTNSLLSVARTALARQQQGVSRPNLAKTISGYPLE